MTTKQPQSWRDQIQIHPAADLFPLMTPDELKALGEDIKANGLQQPIVLWQPDAGMQHVLLDGRSRLDAIEIVIGQPVNVEPVAGCSQVVVLDKTTDPYTFVVSSNLHRRHLTADQKREVIAALLKANPGKSDRQIAKEADSNRTTVGQIRRELEHTGTCQSVDTRTDTKGRRQPARKPAKKKQRDIEHYIAEKAALNDDDVPARAPHPIDPDDLIFQFTTKVRARSLELIRQIEAAYRSQLVERLYEVIDEVALEAERWAKEPDRREELANLPTFMMPGRRRS